MIINPAFEPSKPLIDCLATYLCASDKAVSERQTTKNWGGAKKACSEHDLNVNTDYENGNIPESYNITAQDGLESNDVDLQEDSNLQQRNISLNLSQSSTFLIGIFAGVAVGVYAFKIWSVWGSVPSVQKTLRRPEL